MSNEVVVVYSQANLVNGHKYPMKLVIIAISENPGYPLMFFTRKKRSMKVLLCLTKQFLAHKI